MIPTNSEADTSSSGRNPGGVDMRKADPSNRPNRPHISSDTQLSKNTGRSPKTRKPKETKSTAWRQNLDATRSNMPQILSPDPKTSTASNQTQNPTTRPRPVGEGVFSQRLGESQAVFSPDRAFSAASPFRIDFQSVAALLHKSREGFIM